jgi:hypothetical protein
MNTNLIKIKAELENLLNTINDYLTESEKDEIVIFKEDFYKIRYLGERTKVKGVFIFDFNNGAKFILNDYNPHMREHYEKLINGELQRIILRKKQQIIEIDSWHINYELEDKIETILRDTYQKPIK